MKQEKTKKKATVTMANFTPDNMVTCFITLSESFYNEGAKRRVANVPSSTYNTYVVSMVQDNKTESGVNK